MMRFIRPLTFSFLALAATAGLVACDHPNAMPSGYTYHHDVYKSPPPPLPKTITAEQRRYMTVEQAEQFRDGTYAILESLTMRAGMPPKPVYVVTPSPLSNFYANIDNDLRDNMRHIGYQVSDTPENAYIFTYDARYLDQTTSDGVTMPTPGGERDNVELVLRVFNKFGEDAQLLSRERGTLYIPGAQTLNIQPNLYAAQPTRANTMPRRAPMDSDRIRTAPYSY